MSTAASILRRGDGAVRLTFPYTQRLVSELKNGVPARHRTYNPDDKSWIVYQPFVQFSSDLVRSYYPNVSITDREFRDHPRRQQRDYRRSETFFTPPPPKADDAWMVMHLQPTAPKELIEAAYKVLARLNHPDAGGTHEAMIRLNEARDTLNQRIGK